jgi:hypothetical protein
MDVQKLQWLSGMSSFTRPKLADYVFIFSFFFFFFSFFFLSHSSRDVSLVQVITEKPNGSLTNVAGSIVDSKVCEI